jgi:hypothetical protein
MTKQSKEIAVLETSQQGPLTVINLDNGMVPDLNNAQALPFDLMSDYWTPEKPGESKRLIFDSIRPRNVKDMQTGEVIQLDCAFFFERTDGGEIRTVCNGSKRLVGVIEGYEMQRGAAMLVTYLGKQKNRTNSFFSDIWSVKPLVINIQSK